MASTRKPPSNRPNPAKPAGSTPKTDAPISKRQLRKIEQDKIRQRQQILTGLFITGVVIVAAIIIIPNLPHGSSNASASPHATQTAKAYSTTVAKVSASQTAVTGPHATQTAVACSAEKTGTYGILSNFSLGPNCSIGGYPIYTLSDGVQYADITIGSGQVAQSTDTVTVNYAGWLMNGTEFDASSKHGGPQQFQLSGLIPGWTEAMAGMQIGGERRMLIPGAQAYGASPPSGSGIPANATLIFDVQLVSIP